MQMNRKKFIVESIPLRLGYVIVIIKRVNANLENIFMINNFTMQNSFIKMTNKMGAAGKF